MPTAPAEFNATLSLALGRNSRLAVGFDTEGFGGIFPRAALAPVEGEEVAEEPAKIFTRADAQLKRSVALAVGSAGHRHGPLRLALVELGLLHASAGGDGLRRAVNYLKHAANAGSMERKLLAMMSSIPQAANGLSLPPPDAVGADLIASRQREAGEAASATDVLQYYCAARAELEVAGVGATLDDKTARLHSYFRAACPAVAADVFFPPDWMPVDDQPIEAGMALVQWCISGGEGAAAGPELVSEDDGGDEEEKPQRVSLAARLGLPRAADTVDEADAATVANTRHALTAVLAAGSAEGDQVAAVGLRLVAATEAGRIHRCVVRDSNSGHQLLLPPANWCPIFASRTMQGCPGAPLHAGRVRCSGRGRGSEPGDAGRVLGRAPIRSRSGIWLRASFSFRRSPGGEPYNGERGVA